ncbi:MAG: single-stranded-DNA-specific exonuclease RecJ [Oligoflexia bacterium]|nr:single-stranded-DNA-specific exonuclease RecJ [Oligoflexia bacterium]
MARWRRRCEDVDLPFNKKFLIAREIKTPEQIKNYLNPSLKDLTDPLKLDGMQAAVTRLKQAWLNQEKVCVYGDYDLDGSSAIALLVEGLKLLSFENVSFYQPSRFEEGYGIHKEALKIIKDQGAKLVISVDCGITAVDEANHAKELNLDLIITDHHLPGKNLPQAVAVINPNKGTCGSDLGHLSGVGVAFYLLMAVKRELGVSVDLKNLLDFFTIGTITDMVPLIKENRILLKHGLKILSQTSKAGLRALLNYLGLEGKDLDTQDVGFTIGPKLNALSRLEKSIRPLDILLCDDKNQAQTLCLEVIKLNNERKSLQEELYQKILDQLTDAEYLKPAIVLGAIGHAGVVGLVATKVAQLTQKPTFIVAWHSPEEGIGSARGVAHDLLPEALNYSSEHLLRHGGHSQAAGFSLLPEQFDKFKEMVLEHYEDKNKNNKMAQEIIEYDFDAKVSDFNQTSITWLTQLGPFGMNNPQPLFKLSEFEITKIDWLKQMHLKVYLTDGKSRLEALMFFAKDRFKDKAVLGLGPGSYSNLELLVEPGFNYFNGQKRLQLLIRDIQITSS